MICKEVISGFGAMVGTAFRFDGGGEKQIIGEVLDLENGGFELVLDPVPPPGQHSFIHFTSSKTPGRRPLAALIETPFSNIRVEIGQVEVRANTPAKISIFGAPGFAARLVF